MVIRIKDVILLAVLAILVLTVFIQSAKIKNQKTVIQAHEVEMTEWQDKYNQSNAKVERIEGDLKTINELYQQQLDTIESLRQLKKKKVDSYSKVDASVKSVVIMDTVVVRDTIRFSYKDNYVNVTGWLKDQVFFEFEQFVPIHIMSYRERVGLFKKQSVVHVVSENPNVTLTGVKSMTVKEPVKRWGFGPQLGLGYSDGLIRPYLGVGVSYNLIRF